jgi:hypothetical protein
MTTFEIIALCVGAGLILFALPLFMWVVFYQANNRLYCRIFEHKSWKLWEKVCKELPFAKFVEHFQYDARPGLENYKFYIHDIGIEKPVEVIYWAANSIVSVHDLSGECVLSDFDRYHSDKAVEIIKGLL